MQAQSFNHRDYRFAYLDSAPEDSSRPVALLLHGFPDESQMWAPQIEALHTQGYRVIAPDTLGCGGSEIGSRISDYQATKVAADHAALLVSLNIEKAHVVGHDWGAVIAWMFAGHHPQFVQSLTVLAVGHPTSYGRSGMAQKIKGWYTMFFLLGGFCEKLLLSDGRFSLGRVFRSHPKMDEVLERVRQPGRMTAALRLYRANVVSVLFGTSPKVQAPTLGIWSEQDLFLVESQMQNSHAWVEAEWEYERWGGNHWTPIEQPDKLSARLIQHFERYASGAES